jgi:uncharacterized protein with PIN domain
MTVSGQFSMALDKFWLCRNCREEFWYWPEVHKHFAEADTAMAAVA